MPSIGHMAVGMAAGRWLMRPQAPDRAHITRAMFWLSVVAWAPDLDIIAFLYKVPYAAAWGHRGAAHSIAFGSLLGAVLTPLLVQYLRTPALKTLLVCMLLGASHGVLDAFTDGGLGIALLWPLSNERFFAPWTPIPVAPIGGAVLSGRGLFVVSVEIGLFLPFILYALWPPRGGGPTILNG